MKYENKKYNFIWWLTVLVLLGGTAVAVLRSMIIGLDIDEQYAVTLAYRIARGDVLVKEMWEPHQTSALIPALFTKLFLVCTGSSEYLMLYLRAVGCLLQLAVSGYWYLVMSHRYNQKISFLTALMIFHTLPKWIMMPEFANQQIWFLLLVFLCTLEYERTHKHGYCVAAGLFMVLEVLAYPSCVLLFPLYVVVLWKIENEKNRKDEQKKRTGQHKGTVLFVATCIFCAVLFLLYLFLHMSLSELLLCVQNILSDGEHSTGLGAKFFSYGKELPGILEYLLCYGVIAGIGTAVISVAQKEHQATDGNLNQPHRIFVTFATFVLLVSVGDQIRLWAMGTVANVHPQMHYLILFLLGGVFYFYLQQDKKSKSENGVQEQAHSNKVMFWAGWMASLLAYLSVLLFTNLDMKASLVHLLPGMLCGFLWWTDIRNEMQEGLGAKQDPKQDPKQDSRPVTKQGAVIALLTFWCLVLIGARTLLVRDTGVNQANMFVVKQKVLDSAGKYIYAPYMVGYQLNADYQFIQENIPDNSLVWYLGNETLVYLMGEQQVCSASTISTPIYDERYLTYFRLNPDKLPDYVVIDQVYWLDKEGDMDPKVKEWIYENYDWSHRKESEFSWIMEKK